MRAGPTPAPSPQPPTPAASAPSPAGPPAFEVRQWVRRQLLNHSPDPEAHEVCGRAIEPARAILLL
eukprot:13345282-Alexandrium_andersonii.AAC.1